MALYCAAVNEVGALVDATPLDVGEFNAMYIASINNERPVQFFHGRRRPLTRESLTELRIAKEEPSAQHQTITTRDSCGPSSATDGFDLQAASYNELRSFAKANGLRLKSPTRDVLVAAIQELGNGGNVLVGRRSATNKPNKPKPTKRKKVAKRKENELSEWPPHSKFESIMEDFIGGVGCLFAALLGSLLFAGCLDKWGIVRIFTE